jgi:adenylosuccinate lyase
MRKKAKFNIQRINELEKITHHDIVAFTRSVGESLGQEKQ